MTRRLAHRAVIGAVVLHATAAFGEDVDDLASLLNENVITTASATSQRARVAPATSRTITADELRSYGIQSLDEALNFLSLGVITQDPKRTPDIGARGVLLPQDDGKHFLLLINGHAINDPLYGAARFDQGAGVPLDVVDSIEVILGPGSVLYGSNAMLGVINVITKDGASYEGGHVLAEHEFDSSVRAGAGAGATFSLFGEQADVSAAAEYYERYGPDLHIDPFPARRNPANGQLFEYRRGVPDGIWGGTIEEAYFKRSASGVLRFRVGEVELNLFANVYRRGIPYTTIDTNVDYDDPGSFEMDRAVRADLRHYATLSAFAQLTSRLYADSYDSQRRVNRQASASCFQSDFETCQYYDAGLARWAGIEERLSLNWLSDLSLVTLLGVDARMRWVSAKQDALDFDTGEPWAPTSGIVDDSALIVSPYIQQTWSPTTWLDLNAGARLDADERFDPIVSPRGAVAVTPFEKTTLKGVYSQAFRAPTWNETDASNYRQVRTAGLDPEVVRSVEGSIEQRFSTQRIMFGVFHTWWDDLVEPRALTRAEVGELQEAGEVPITSTNLVQHRNVSELSNHGYNGAFDGSLDSGRLTYGVNATAAYTRIETPAGTQELAVAPRFFGNAHVAYDFGGLFPKAALAAYYVGPRPHDRAFKDAYVGDRYVGDLAEFRLTLTGPVPAVAGLSYRASLNVATAGDSAYTGGPSSAAGNPQEPRFVPIDQLRAFVGLRYDFFTGEQTAYGEAR